jgi:alcohol dehydrogenase class IV
LNIPTLKDVGTKEADLQELAERSAINVSAESNPRKAGVEEFLEIFKQAYDA